MKKATDKKKEIISAALRGDRAEFERLTRKKMTFFKVDNDFFNGNLETPISEEKFKELYQPGYDSFIETGTKKAQGMREEMQRFGFSEAEIEARIGRLSTAEETVNNINKLIEKLERE